MTVSIQRALCVGHGPSRKDWNYIRNFDGPIISVDASVTELYAEQIFPDYAVYAETGHTVIRNLVHFMPDYMKYDGFNKIIIVYKKRQMVYLFTERINELKLKSMGFDGYYGHGKNHQTQAVGLYAIAFADMVLGAIDVHLIGYDYKGLDNDGRDMCEVWKERTIHYLKTRLSCGYEGVIVDHSGGDFPVLL